MRVFIPVLFLSGAQSSSSFCTFIVFSGIPVVQRISHCTFMILHYRTLSVFFDECTGPVRDAFCNLPLIK
jgi:hypothetical protein